MTNTKKLINTYHFETTLTHGLVRKAKAPKTYFVYWMDGEIERRDTYFIQNGFPVLESMQQFENNTWIHIQ